MKNLITSKIQNLPPLPKTVIEIERIRSSMDPDNEELITAIQSDPMIVANILKVCNSAMY
jgi:HD-like signal output (HDOD) protein